MRTETKIAKDLLSIGAVFLRPGEPFTWASRYPLAHLLRQPHHPLPSRRPAGGGGGAGGAREGTLSRLRAARRDEHGGHRARRLRERNPRPADVLCARRGQGPRTGEPHRGTRRTGGEGRRDRGPHLDGGSVLEVVDALRQAGCEVLGIASIFTYGLEKGVKRLADAGVQNASLLLLRQQLLAAAVEEGVIAREDVPRLERFRQNPQDGGWMTL